MFEYINLVETPLIISGCSFDTYCNVGFTVLGTIVSPIVFCSFINQDSKVATSTTIDPFNFQKKKVNDFNLLGSNQ